MMKTGIISKYLGEKLFGKGEKDPGEAYDLWASSYDSQPDNLMLALDEEAFSSLLKYVEIENNVVADIGCGTGRHWPKLFQQKPQRLIGFDVSAKMLEVLHQKFPLAETIRIINNHLPFLEDESVDVIISTLSIAHIKNIEEAFNEWDRVLKPGGDMILTDYHPEALAMGADRTFSYNNKTIAIVNYVHPLEKVISIAKSLRLYQQNSIEKNIDDSVKPFYEKNNAMHVFNKWQNSKILYGLHFIKEK